MRDFYQFTAEEQLKALRSARDYYEQHAFHVDFIRRVPGNGYPPSGSDCFIPELWKSLHWKWFVRVGTHDLKDLEGEL